MKDREEGESYEMKIQSYILETYGLEVKKNPKAREIDLISDLLDIEVKYDRQMATTGNIFVEFEGKEGRKSGIFANEPEGLFIYGNDEKALVFSIPRLQELVLEWIVEKKYRIINAGDGWRSKGFLISYEEAKKYARKEIIF